jgi:thioredoxin reductase (NADPH)
MSDKVQDIIMIGAGPSALTAAIYTSREDINTLIYEKSVVGGVVAIIDKVENYPGFADGVEGFVLAEQLEKQAKRFGAKIEIGDVISIRDKGSCKALTIDGKTIMTKAVLIATGRSYSKLGVPGESEYFGHGVHYCATCDGAFYNKKRLVVVGGSNSAIQESIYLTRFASHIDVVVRSTIKASAILKHDLEKLIDEGIIAVYLGTTVDEIIGDNGHVNSVRAIKNGKSMTIETDGVFIFAGLAPNTQFLAGSGIELDEAGFIKTDAKLQTNIPGIYASGDVRSGSTKQITSATGEGTTVALSIREYIHNL